MKKRFLSIILALFMVLLLAPATASAEGETGNVPSVSAFATKQQLMDVFTPYNTSDVGKVVFGKNSEGEPQEWFIVGKDAGVAGDNTMIYAVSPIARKLMFRSNPTNGIEYDPSWGCEYGSNSVSEVAANHYGSSDIRRSLQEIAGDTGYFTTAEQDMMNDTPIRTVDFYGNRSVAYVTTDKLYLLSFNDFDVWVEGRYPEIGSPAGHAYINEQTFIYNDNSTIWTRSPNDIYDGFVRVFYDQNSYFYAVNAKYDVCPAGNLNLSSVLFASAAEASTCGIKSGVIESDKAMTLRLDGTGKSIGTVRYNDIEGIIAAKKDPNASNPVSLVVQGNDGTRDWYYSMQLEDTSEIYVSKGMLKVACGLSDLSLEECKIWLETTDDSTGMPYAVMATWETPDNLKGLRIRSVSLTGVIPTPGQTFPSTCQMKLPITTHDVIYTTKVNGVDVPVTGTVEWNTTYKATIEMGTFIVYNTSVCYFDSSVYVVIDGEVLPDYLSPGADGVLTITKEFTTGKRESITGIEPPQVPAGGIFTNYYGYEGYEELPVSGSELGKQASAAVLDKSDSTTKNKAVNVIWTIENADGTGYDKTPGAVNTFRWTIPASELADYDAANCPGYDSSAGTVTGTVSIANKAPVPVAITGTDSAVDYTGADIDVSRYFAIDPNAGTPAYSLMEVTEGSAGEGILKGSILSVNKTGLFNIKLNTAANGIYAAGEENIILTVANGKIQYEASGYSGSYDGQSHSIEVNVSAPSGTAVTYSTDGTAYDKVIPLYVDEGSYTVYYRIQGNNYDTAEGSKTVTITKRPVTITAKDQNVFWGNEIDQTKYAVSENGIASGDKIASITLAPSTSNLTDDGTISVSSVKIENAAGRDVTGNYDISLVNGTLKIAHDASLVPDRIEAFKTKTTYMVGETLNVDDITVTAYY